MERLRTELRQQITEERADVDELFTEARQWRKAQDVRAYIAAVEKLPVRKKDRTRRANWIAWASEQADRQDPLTDSPPSILDTPRRQYREPDPYEMLNDDGEIEHI